MNKQYIFLSMLGIFLYILYLVISFSIEEYKESKNITKLQEFIIETSNYNQEALATIEYKQTQAYKRMILKEESQKREKGEGVIYLTSQQNYNKFTLPENEEIDQTETFSINEYNVTDTMEINQKWKYFLFESNTY